MNGSLMRRCIALMLACVWMPMASAQEAGDRSALWEQASLYRDEWGVPHVYAENPRAMAFAFGYAQAEDHVEAMLMAYRIANGRAAEVLGEALAESDEFALKMAHGDLARKAFSGIDPLTVDLCEGFALGVNAWIVEHPDRTPSWGDGVRPEDPLALMHCYLMSFAPFDLADTYHREAAATSGNAWAMAPGKTESGEPMLAINPHCYYDSPFRWYEAHLVCPEIDIAGATLFGIPVIMQGHNAVLGWALTPNQPDFADVYIESLGGRKQKPNVLNTPASSDESRTLKQMMIASARPYYVHTAHGADQRSVSCMAGGHGPLVGTDKGRPCSYCIGGYEDFGVFAELMEMARAADLGSFQAALSMQQLPCFHIVYADRGGNIFYLYNAKMGDKPVADAPPPEPPPPPKEPVPAGVNMAPPEEAPMRKQQREPKIIDWNAPLPGDNPLFAWRGIIPADTLPSVTNPDTGYIQACGTPPWLVTERMGLDPGTLPGWFSHDRDTLRAQRVRRLLSMGKRSFRDCQAMLYDVVVPAASAGTTRLIQLADAHADFAANAHPDLAAGIDVLRSWNGLADSASPGMTFFHAWWSALRGQTPHLAGVETAYKTDDALMAAIDQNDPTFQEAALKAAEEAARMMRNEFESVSVPWGDVHSVTRGTREVGLPGATGGEPIFVASDSLYDARKWRVTYGYGFAMLVSFGEKPAAVSMVPFGSSEDPRSPHFADQLDLMAERRFKVTRFAMEDVQRHASSARGRMLHLRPKGTAGLITLTASSPIEARLNALVEPPAAPPEGLVPFTMYLEIEKAPKATPLHTRLDISVSAVLCARENLPSLALYACDGQRNWVRLPAQSLDAEARTFAADDDQGPSTYAVLGPGEFRAKRLEIPGETGGDAAPPPPAEPQPESPSLEPETPAETVPDRMGAPPKHSRAPIVIPKDAEEAKPQETPKLKLDLPPANDGMTKPAKEAAPAKKTLKRNYQIQNTGPKQQAGRRQDQW